MKVEFEFRISVHLGGVLSRLWAVLLVFLLVSDSALAHTDVPAPQYKLVFADEFNGPDGSAPDTTVWRSSQRFHAIWNRWVSDTLAVAFVRKGRLVLRALPNGNLKADTAQMLTGAVNSMNRYAFQYGKIEVRMRTNRHRGNFPAAWLLPQPPAERHPYGGEVDIFESFGSDRHSYHTAHTHWTVDLGRTKNPPHQFRKKINVKRWHVYALEWDEEKLVWRIDGEVVGVYAKSKNADDLKNGQWPYDHPFYIVLNQSVGNESWAEKPDYKYRFETQVDWVRVYERKK